MKHLIWTLCVIAVTALPVWPKAMVVFRYASPPLPVESGQDLQLCAANVGTAAAEITLQFVSVRTGAIVAAHNVTLPPPGSGTPMPDPCLTTSSDAIASMGVPAGNGAPLVVGLLIARRGLFARATAVTAAVQVTGADAAGRTRVLGNFPLYMATQTNGRNTPIEIVH